MSDLSLLLAISSWLLAHCSFLKNFEATASDVGYDNGGNAGNKDCHTAVADTLDLDKGALDTIEHATNNLHGSALGEVYLFGIEVDEFLIITVADGDELIHLTIGNHNGDAKSTLGTGEVLKVIDLGLQRLDALTGGVNKQQVVDGGDKLAYLAMLAIADNLVLHGNETTNRMGLQEFLGLERTTKRGTHGIPNRKMR